VPTDLKCSCVLSNIFQSARRPALLPSQTSRRRRPQAHDLSKDDDLAQVMSIVIRYMNYGVSVLSCGQAAELQARERSFGPGRCFLPFSRKVRDPRSTAIAAPAMCCGPQANLLLPSEGSVRPHPHTVAETIPAKRPCEQRSPHRMRHSAETAHRLVRRHILNSHRQLGQLAWCGDNDNQGEIREDRYTSGHHLPRLLVIDSSIEQSGQASTDENEVPDPTE
jgi:hypothetical protein